MIGATVLEFHSVFSLSVKPAHANSAVSVVANGFIELSDENRAFRRAWE